MDGDVSAWLVGAASRALGPEELVATLAARLREAGVPVARVSTSILTKHPEVYVHNVTWSRSDGTFVTEPRHDVLTSPRYVGGPVERIHAGDDRIRVRLEDEAEASRFGITRELRADGMTDYVVYAIVFGDGQRTFASFASDAPGGFGDAGIAALDAIVPALGARVELAAAHHATRALLEVYLGKNAAGRVLSGAFRRGTGELSRCAIVFSDMRGFTDFADQRAPAEVVATLDRFFGIVARPIHAEGGEILKFIGDAVMAVFQVTPEVTPAEACARALRAGRAAVTEVAAELEGVRLGMSLHFGEVLYGNIGAQDRLDFTVIGAAVNEASRIEGLCKTVGRPLLLSTEFVEALGAAGETVPLGRFALKGVGREVEIHAPR